MMDKADLLTRIAKSRAQLEEVLDDLSDAQLTQPFREDGWSIKAVIAHIGLWENRTEELFSLLQRNETPPAFTGETIDSMNERSRRESQDRSLVEVRQMELSAYQSVINLISDAAEDDLFDPQRFPWMRGEPFVAVIVGNTYDHHDEHREEIENWLAQST